MADHTPTILEFPRQLQASGYLARPFKRRGLAYDARRIYRVRGNVVVDPDVPVARMVYLYSEDDFMLQAQMLSDPITGAFEFNHLFGFFTYMAVAFDHTGEYRAEAHDKLVPELMA